MIGKHLIKCWAKAQHVISLSSGEAELYAGVKAASEMIGMKSLAKDFGHNMGMILRVDATAAMAMMSREGLGKAKHIDTQYLWVQEKLKSGEFAMEKVHTDRNPADLFTKQLTERVMSGHLARMNVQSEYAVPEKCTGQSGAASDSRRTEGE